MMPLYLSGRMMTSHVGGVIDVSGQSEASVLREHRALHRDRQSPSVQ